MKLAGTIALTKIWAKIKAYIASATCNAANKLSAKRTISVTNFAVGSLSSDLSGDESLMLRRNMFIASGQNSSDVSNSWHKVANFTNNRLQCDCDLTLTVLSAFVNSQNIRGQLNVHVRSYSTSAIGSAGIRFLWASGSVIPGRFRLLVKDNVAELWVNTPDRYADILFIYDYDVFSTNNEYNPWSINSSGTASALPTDYAQYSAVINDYPRSTQAVQDGSGNVITSTYLPISGGSMTGLLSITNTGTGNYSEGIRIHPASNSWDTIMLCGSDSTGDSGTSTNSWGIFNNEGRFYISRNGSSNGGSSTLSNVNNLWGVNTATPDHTLTVNGSGSFTGEVHFGSGNYYISSDGSNYTGNASSATKAVQDGNGNVIADRYIIATSIETSYETNLTGKVVAFGRYYSTGSKSNVHTTFETFITAAGLAWVLSDTPVAYSNRLKSSAWDWSGSGPSGTGTTVKKIATITGLGYVRLEGNNVIGASMARSNWRLDISAASSSVIANATTTTTTVTFGYTYESGVLTLYLGERNGENTYNMFASEVMAGAAITWEYSSVAAIARPSGFISI